MLNLTTSVIKKASDFPSDKVCFRVYNSQDGKFIVQIFSNIKFEGAFLSLNSIKFGEDEYIFVHLNRVKTLWKRLLMFLMEHTPLECRDTITVFFVNEVKKRKTEVEEIYEKTDLLELSNFLNPTIKDE